MRRILSCIIIFMCVLLFQGSCTKIKNLIYVYKSKININEAIKEKEKINNSDNPALKYRISQELSKKRIEVENVLVKDITTSQNIDYNFCVIASVRYKKGEVECYIYARDFYGNEDVKTIAALRKGKTKIDAVGDFARFFSLLDEAYTKIEIINASISIRED